MGKDAVFCWHLAVITWVSFSGWAVGVLAADSGFPKTLRTHLGQALRLSRQLARVCHLAVPFFVLDKQRLGMNRFLSARSYWPRMVTLSFGMYSRIKTAAA